MPKPFYMRFKKKKSKSTHGRQSPATANVNGDAHGLIPDVTGKKGAHSVPKIAPIDYEALLVHSLQACGYRVVENAVWRKDKTLQADPTVIVRQLRPRPLDETGKARAWALDFAYPLSKVGLEIDGFGGYQSAGGHRTWTGFHRDRQKDRALMLAGWRIMRFGTGDLHSAADRLTAVNQFTRLIAVAGGPDLSHQCPEFNESEAEAEDEIELHPSSVIFI